jgi:hypothetical protein
MGFSKFPIVSTYFLEKYFIQIFYNNLSKKNWATFEAAQLANNQVSINLRMYKKFSYRIRFFCFKFCFYLTKGPLSPERVRDVAVLHIFSIF